MSTKTAQGTLWVCTCCLFAREGEGCEGQHDHDREPWSLEPRTDVTLGLPWSEHYSPRECERRFREEGDGGCGCDRVDFRTRWCDGCGSPLAGERHAYTWWA